MSTSLGEFGLLFLFAVTATTKNLFSIFLFVIKRLTNTFWGVLTPWVLIANLGIYASSVA
jgi:hypothetical protein